MRPCQPAPVERKLFSTSLSRRNVTCCFKGAFCGPRSPTRRFGKMATSSGGKTSAAGRNLRISAIVNSRTSPALLVKGFFITRNLSLVCFAKADNSNTVLGGCKTNHMQSHINVSKRYKSRLWIGKALICFHQSCFPNKFRNRIKRQSTLARVFAAFDRIKIYFHRLNYGVKAI